jgi:hypothetical protein
MALKGYHPEVRYTKLVHGDRGETIVMYFDKGRKLIGTGGLLDHIWFKYIPSEDRRLEPSQVVNFRAYYDMPQDAAEIRIVTRRKGTKHGSSR